MKLYILKAREDLPKGDDPWDPWFDKMFAIVVNARSAREARMLAHENAGNENRSTFLGEKIAKTETPWLDKKYSTCRELTPGKIIGVVISDYRSA